MKIGSIIVNNMGRTNSSLWLWLDIKFEKYWYVFSWRKKSYPYMYKSFDGTPPKNMNEGNWFFGRNNYGY